MATWYSNGAVNGNANHNWNATNAWNDQTDGLGTAGNPGSGDHAVVQDGDTITLTNHPTVGSVQIEEGSTLQGGGYRFTLDDGGNEYILNIDGTILSYLDVTIVGITSRSFDGQSADDDIRHIVITPASGTPTFTLGGSSLVLSGDLTINGGELDTGTKDLTVAGDVTGAGTLTGNASAISMGTFAMTGTYNATTGSTIITDRTGAGYQLSCAVADIVHNDGTFDFRGSSSGASDIRLNGASDGTNGFHDVIINASGRTVSILSYALTIDGTLTITAGTFSTGGSNYALTVTEDVSVTGTLTGNASAIELGSLTIASGGTYNATSGTTTITDESGTGYAVQWNSGTFNHNLGTVEIKTDDNTEIYTGLGSTHPRKFYNLIINSPTSTRQFAWKTTVNDQRDFVILGDLTITSGQLKTAGSARGIEVYGNTYITANGKFNYGGDLTTGTCVFHGLVTNYGNFTPATSTGATLNGGIRNLGTFTSDDTLTIGGTGGILEGDLEDAIINVNLDSHFSSTDSTDDQQILGDSIANLGNQTNFTIMAWVKQDSSQTDGAGTIVMSGDNFHFKLHESGYVNFSCRPGGVATSVTTIGTYGTAWTKAADGWHHLCGTWDSSTGGGTLKIYIDGVEWATRASVGTSATTDGTKELKMFTKDENHDDQLAGSIMDVKCFNSYIGETDIALMATKINADISSLSSTSQTACQVWYKLNDVTDTYAIDSSGQDPANDGPAGGISTNASALTKVYDAFSVNVQDGDDTTTDGAVTVEQGKLEGLALSSVNFNGTSAYVATDTPPVLGANQTISMWVNWASVPANNVLLSNGIGGSMWTPTNGWTLFGNDLQYHFGAQGAQNDFSPSYTSITTGKWQHVVVTSDDTGNTLYVDGVLIGTDADVIAAKTQTLYIGAFEGDSYFFDGNIRDVRIYDYDISADQVSSLYSGDYNVTPKYWWKIDEGTGATATIADSGTATAVDGTGVSLAWTNGALDIGSKLTTDADGILSAPRGELSGLNHMIMSGSFIHNSGSVTLDEGDVDKIAGAGTVTFYKLTGATSGGGAQCRVQDITSLVVEHTLDVQTNFWMTAGAADAPSLTIGTTSATGNLKLTSQALTVYGNFGVAVTVQGASELYPVNITQTSGDWDFDDAHSSHDDSLWNLKWLNFNYDVATPGTAGDKQSTLQLTGDCEFDAFTISDGDTLDLNGKRMAITSYNELSNAGTVDAKSSTLYMAYYGGAGTFDNDGDTNVVYQHADGSRTWAFAPNVSGTSVINDDLSHELSADTTLGNLIFADNSTTGFRMDYGGTPYDITCTNLTIATDGKLVDESEGSIITCSGDINMAGGLIGKSAIDLNGSSDRVALGTQLDSDITTSQTWEAWVKPSDTGTNPILANDSVTRGGYLRVDSGARWFLTGLSSGIIDATSTIVANKWVHIAGVYDGSYLYMYVNGKLENKVASTGTVTVGQNMWIGHHANNDTYFDGTIGRVSVWDAALTATQIRTMMFQNFTDATTTDCVAWYQFDEGTSTDVADSSGSGFDGTYAGDSWVGAGTFTGGTSTLKFNKAGTQYFNYLNSEYIAGITVANGSTTILNDIVGHEHPVYVSGSLTVSGTMDNTSGEYLRFGDNFVANSSVLDVANGTITGVSNFVNDASGTITLTAGTYPAWVAYYGTLSLGDDVTFNGGVKLQGESSYTPELVFNGYTATVKEYVSLRKDAILNIGSGTLHYDHAGGSGIITSGYTGQTLLAGPGATIKGHSPASKTPFESMNNFKVVGTCENLNVTLEELRVTGHVINCTGDIIQQHPSIDADQQLDYDTADDRDIMLGRDLDKNTELVT